MYPIKSIVWAAGALCVCAAPAVAAPKTALTFEGPVEVSSPLVSPEAARSALETRFEAAAACVAEDAGPLDASLKLEADVGGDGTIIALRRVESSVPDAISVCVEVALRAAKLDALPDGTASAMLTVALRLKVEGPSVTAPSVMDPSVSAPTVAAPSVTAPQGAAAPSVTGSATQISATAPIADAAPTKPWKVDAKFSQSLGQGTFVPGGGYDSYSWSGLLKGTYKVHELVSAGLRFDFDQELTTSFKSEGTVPREFQFRDIRLSASAPVLYTEETYTGIKLGAALEAYLPVSKLSRAQEQILGTRVMLLVNKTFEKVGPGDLALDYTAGLKLNLRAKATQTLNPDQLSAVCRSANRDVQQDCISSFATTSHYFMNDFSVSYVFLENFTALLGLTIFNTVASELGTSELPTALQGKVDRSPNATDTASQADTVWGTVELAYQINDMFAVAAGLLTVSNPFIQSGSSNGTLRFPWWNFNGAADNLSTVYLDVAFTY